MNAAVKFGQGSVKVQDLFVKEGYKNGCIVVKSIRLYLIECLPKILVSPRRFSKPEHTILNADPIMVLHRVETESSHVTLPMEVDQLELVVEETDDFLLGKACKTEGDDHDFWEILTSNIVLFCQPPL